ncbi:MAG: accessory factor UbiK family protein [Hyphomicrobium sp.]|jgi:BMFP domain-containing protein YqiC
MTQTSNRLFDDLARLVTDAAGAAQGVRREVEQVVRGQTERIVQTMDLVTREEFEAVRAMAEKARAENERLAALAEALSARIAALEADHTRPSPAV